MNILHTKDERDEMLTTTCKSVRELMSAMYGGVRSLCTPSFFKGVGWFLTFLSRSSDSSNKLKTKQNAIIKYVNKPIRSALKAT